MRKVARLAGHLAAEGAAQVCSTRQGGLVVVLVAAVEGVQALVPQLQLAQWRLGAGLLAWARWSGQHAALEKLMLLSIA